MKKILIIGIIACIISLVALAGCDVNPSKITDEYADIMTDKITYAQDARTGLCFGVIASRKTGSTDQTGFGMGLVPCDKVKHLIKNWRGE